MKVPTSNQNLKKTYCMGKVDSIRLGMTLALDKLVVDMTQTDNSECHCHSHKMNSPSF